MVSLSTKPNIKPAKMELLLAIASESQFIPPCIGGQTKQRTKPIAKPAKAVIIGTLLLPAKNAKAVGSLTS